MIISPNIIITVINILISLTSINLYGQEFEGYVYECYSRVKIQKSPISIIISKKHTTPLVRL